MSTPVGSMGRMILGLGAVLVALGQPVRAGEPRELRGVWIAAADTDVFESRASIADAMEFLARHHVNVVFPDVWYRGVTLHPSALLERTFGVRQDPQFAGRDPLAEMLVEAHRRGIEVMPWFEYGFAASNAAAPTTILAKKPEWAARDREGRVATRQAFSWMNAFDPAVQSFVAGLMLEVARNYDVDGVQGDDRLPAQPSIAGYDTATSALWRKEMRLSPPTPEDPKWIAWRAGILTEFLARLVADVREVREGMLFSSSPSPFRFGLEEYLQDTRTWVDRGLVDLFHPQCYRREFVNYAKLADEQFALVRERQRVVFAPGILIQSGDWRIEPDELVKMIRHGRERGYGGEVLFHYAGLRADEGRLARALLAGPYADAARVPYRSSVRRPIAPTIVPRPRTALDEFARENGHLRARKAGRAELAYSLDARTAGWYQVHVEFPSGVELPSSIECSTSADADVTTVVTPIPGLVGVGSVRLDGRALVEMRLTTNSAELGRLVAGDAVLILDRVRSPDAVWR